MKKKELRFRSNGEFHILMISDLHAGPKYNRQTKAGILALLKETEPDLVLLNGDVSVGGRMYEGEVCTQESLRAFLNDVMEDIEAAGIPWAHVYGNHDRESGLDLEKQQKVYEERPYCLSSSGPRDIHGVGNYVLPVLSHDGKSIAYNIWGMDSLSEYTDYQEAFGMPGCGFRLPNTFGDGASNASPVTDQVMWYYNTSLAMEKECGYKIPAIMYMHIPLLEMQLISRNRDACNFEGRKRERICSSELNSGLYMACLQRGDVKGIFFGHEHLNDFSGELFGVTMAYDGAIGYDMSTTDDMRGGREIILYENPEKKLKTRQIRLIELMGDRAIRNGSSAKMEQYSLLADKIVKSVLCPREECSGQMKEWDWSQGIVLFGIYQLFRGTRRPELLDFMLKWFDNHISKGLPEKNINTMCPLLTLNYLYEETGKENYLNLCKEWANYAIQQLPRTKEGGLQHLDHTGQLWMNTLYMSVLFLSRAGVLLRDDILIQEGIRQLLIHIKYLSDPVTGLFYHRWSFEGDQHLDAALTAEGNAWYIAGLVDYVEIVNLPKGVNDILLSTLQRQAEAFEKYQDAEGMWHMLVNQPETTGVDVSATAAISYGLLKATRKGMIESRYGLAGIRGLKAIEKRMNESGIQQEVSAHCLYGQIMALLLLGEASRNDNEILSCILEQQGETGYEI